MHVSVRKLCRWGCYWLRRVFCWQLRDRPRRMRRRGRAPDPTFAPSELLYMRARRCHVEDARLTDVSAIRFPDQSVNRSKYGEPSDVLIPDPVHEKSSRWIHLGVLEFPVEAVPACLTTNDHVACDFRVEHDPLERNYAHSEILAYRDGTRIRENKGIGKAHRKRYRLAIMDKARVVIEPLE